MCKISVSSVPTHRMGIITCLFSRLFWRLKFKNVCKSISRTMPHSWLRNCSLFKLTVRCKGGLIWELSQVMTLNNNNNKQMICYVHTVNFIIKNTHTHTCARISRIIFGKKRPPSQFGFYVPNCRYQLLPIFNYKSDD